MSYFFKRPHFFQVFTFHILLDFELNPFFAHFSHVILIKWYKMGKLRKFFQKILEASRHLSWKILLEAQPQNFSHETKHTLLKDN